MLPGLKFSLALKWILLSLILIKGSAVYSQSDDTVIQPASSMIVTPDSLKNDLAAADSSSDFQQKEINDNSSMFSPNRLIATKDPPVPASIIARTNSGAEIYFYSIFIIALMLAVIRIFFDKYFINLFRVFFNTSLRQSQLKDQLLQSAFPSLTFNLFFFISGGYYLYLLLEHYNRTQLIKSPWAPFICILVLAVIYSFKFVWLSFTGWVTGAGREMKAYVFNVFLTNKILGIFLLAFMPLIAFSDKPVSSVAITVSAMLILIMLVFRFFRSYGLVADYFKLGRFHFLLYIISLEILPLLLLYKFGLMILDKNL